MQGFSQDEVAKASTPALLPPEDLASQLSTIEVLLSIYNGSSDLDSIEVKNEESQDDVVLSSESYKAIQDLAHFLSLPLDALGKAPSVELRDGLPAIIQLGIKLDPLRGTLNEEDGLKAQRKLLLNVGIVTRRLGKAEDKDTLLKPRWNLKQADWLDRPAYDALCNAAKSVEWEDESVGYIMNVIETISEASLDYTGSKGEFSDTQKANGTKCLDESSSASTSDDLVVRTWHLFPSLSMKDKRKDLVSYAQKYNLTGFVLAGKPGLMALEHSMHGITTDECIDNINSYWSDIKTTSWSDLPPGHKKVSEKHREVGVTRCFVDIKDVTSIEEIGGATPIIDNGRVRKNDLDKLKTWLQSQGCTGQLELILGKD
jgi:hypothetical protein